ncbi:hypothetical protein ACFSCX_14010 [Bacillus salitolerans]|uniref:Spore germination protein n=1 Tax=Bacillus salitolerans TaxID=1437434 RepID=A0ABW4LRH2_9BACI
MTKIKIDHFKIGNINHTSSVQSGINIPTNWSHVQSSSEGFGTINGLNNQMKDNTSIVKKSRNSNG